MNNNFLISSFLSLFIHILLFFPINFFATQGIDIDLIKGPASIEISIVRPISHVRVETKNIEEIPAKEKNDMEEKALEDKSKDEILSPKEKNINAIPMIGALTEQISSLMINKPPRYPTLARIKGWEGEVVLIASINDKGEVLKVNILSSSGFYILDEAAKESISRWSFRNVLNAIEVKIPVRFVLTDLY